MSTSYIDHECLKQIIMNQYTSLKFSFQFLCVFTFQSWVLNHLKLWCKWNIHIQQSSIVLYFWYSSTCNCHVEFMCSKKSSVQVSENMLLLVPEPCKWQCVLQELHCQNTIILIEISCTNIHMETKVVYKKHVFMQFFSLSCLTGFGSTWEQTCTLWALFYHTTWLTVSVLFCCVQINLYSVFSLSF